MEFACCPSLLSTAIDPFDVANSKGEAEKMALPASWYEPSSLTFSFIIMFYN
jgi:hypothetical protein